MPKASPSDADFLAAAAVHELGHALTAIRHSRTILKVSLEREIVEDGHALATTTIAPPKTRAFRYDRKAKGYSAAMARRYDARVDALISMGGQAAEALVLGAFSNLAPEYLADHHDVSHATREIAIAEPEADPHEAVNRYRWEAMLELGSHASWNTLLLFAPQLLRDHELDGGLLERTYARVKRDPHFVASDEATSFRDRCLEIGRRLVGE